LSVEALTRTLSEMVAINSVNPAHCGPAGGEGRVIAWVAEFLRQIGLEPSLSEAEPGRPNLRVRLEGRLPGPPLLFTTHVDTVSVHSMTIDPFGAEHHEGRLYGRGATDAKGQATALLHALAAWAEAAQGGEPPPRAVELALVVGEEVDFAGSRALLAQGIEATGIVIAEPTGMRLVTTHKGCLRWWIRLEGKSVHSAKPHLGVNAITAAAALIGEIDQTYTTELKRRSAPLLGSPTVNVGRIGGGEQANMVPDHCRIELDRRTIPGESAQQVRGEFEALFDRLRHRNPTFHAVQDPPLLEASPMQTSPEDPLVHLAAEVVSDHGWPVEPIGVDYATDGSVLSQSGLPIIVIGPGSIDQAHTADEFVDLESVAEGARFFADLMGRHGAG
jgi:acetylornithine deacetylase/succinyl-diaminopimelate desuccinylase family protein